MLEMKPKSDSGNNTVRKYKLIWYGLSGLAPRTSLRIPKMEQTRTGDKTAYVAYGVSSQAIYNGCIVEVTMNDGSVERGKCIGRNTIVMFKRPRGTGGGQTPPQPLEIKIIQNGGKK